MNKQRLFITSCISIGTAAMVFAIRGDVAACREHGQEALGLRRHDTDYPRDASEALALLELSLGRYDEAIDQLRRGVQQMHADAGSDLIESSRDLMEAYLRSGRQLTGPMRAVLAAHLQGANLAIDIAVAWRLRGLAAPDTAFDECFENALKEHVAAAYPFETARTHLTYGERLRRAGRRGRKGGAPRNLLRLDGHRIRHLRDAETERAALLPRARNRHRRSRAR